MEKPKLKSRQGGVKSQTNSIEDFTLRRKGSKARKFIELYILVPTVSVGTGFQEQPVSAFQRRAFERAEIYFYVILSGALCTDSSGKNLYVKINRTRMIGLKQ